jgi:hypothetical protein
VFLNRLRISFQKKNIGNKFGPPNDWARGHVWPVMDVRLLNAVILVYDTWGQEGNCGLLEATKGVKKCK